jgi:hypothetical protein
MKRLIAACLALLLSACGGQEPGKSTTSVVLSSSRALQLQPSSPVSEPGERRSYDITWSSTTNVLSGKSNVLTLADFRLPAFEVRLQDISLTYDKEGPGGQLYRLYQAAFGRVPDVRGFGYWKDAVEKRGLTIAQVATAFLESSESRALYGAPIDDQTFISRLYQNVLGRGPDPGGAAFWANSLKLGTKRIQVLLAFSESAENKASTAATALGGMPFAEPGVTYIPVSNARGPKDVPVGVMFEVDGSPSTDANDDKLSFAWAVAARPSASIAAFVSPDAEKPKIILDIPGTYQLTLWASDASSRSYSPAQLIIVAHGIVADSGTYTCSSLVADRAATLYSLGHSYLDRDKDGKPCTAADIAYEKAPPVATLPDLGIYRCSTISHEYAVLLYLQGHTYLDRDHDGKPCEATDITVENSKIIPPAPPPSTSGLCWVNGYTRRNGTHVNGYWRRC